MSIRNLDSLFRPKSIAVVGASKLAGSLGAVLARNLFNAGFSGPIMPVNPKYTSIEGVLTYPDIASLPITPELAVLITPAETVPDLITELGQRGTRAAVVVSSGFGESPGARGKELQQAMCEAARPWLMRILGPNSLGLMVPALGLNASLSHLNPRPGQLAFVAQSGAVVTAVADWADKRNIGFSHMISLGGMADVDVGDMLDYLANDSNTRAIMLYIESVTDARKFLSAGRAAARMKPVVLVKAGRRAEGARAAASHTGALIGNDEVYDTVFYRAGMLRVTSLIELFDAVEILAVGRRPRGERMAIISNGGGIGVMATDALVDEGGTLAELAPETVEQLAAVLPATWSRSNPVDIDGNADAQRYQQVMEILMRAPGIDAVLVLNSPTAVTSGYDAAMAVIRAIDRRPNPMVLTSWVGDQAASAGRELFAIHKIPSYYTPGQAVHAFMYMLKYQRSQQMLMETPASIPSRYDTDRAQARTLLDSALKSGSQWLNERDAKRLLDCYNIPVTNTRVASTPDQAARIAEQMNCPVVLKILSENIAHKSVHGGVVLDLVSPEQVRSCAHAMLERISQTLPEIPIEGFTVAPMINRPGSFELIAGMFNDPQFGPVILFGNGGTAVELVDDKALGLPPLNMHLARDMIRRTRIYRLLQAHQERPGVDLDAIAVTLIKLAQLVSDLPEIEAVDINPLLADEYGVLALDARIGIRQYQGDAGKRLAIRPYPRDLEQTITREDGSALLLRPIRPEDEPGLQQAFKQLTPEQVRLRFFVPMKTLSHVMAARFTQIDYDREMALVLTEPGLAGQSPIYGVVHISADPDNIEAEYDILLRNEMAGQGLGRLLMQQIIDYARTRGITLIFGNVLSENTAMLGLCDRLGFKRRMLPDEPGMLRVELKLG